MSQQSNNMRLNNPELKIFAAMETYIFTVMGAIILEYVPYGEFWEGSDSFWGIPGNFCWNSGSVMRLEYAMLEVSVLGHIVQHSNPSNVSI